MLGGAERRKPRHRHAVPVDVSQGPRRHQQPTLEQARHEGIVLLDARLLGGAPGGVPARAGSVLQHLPLGRLR
jgi:hypothetical protein